MANETEFCNHWNESISERQFVTKQINANADPKDELARQLVNDNGPLLTGKALWETMGYQSAAAFRQSKIRRQVGVRIFSVPNRRGTFAFTQDVADWLRNLAEEGKM